jgi:hypothetical protein
MGSYYRTEALKTSHYFCNGEGRDTYIQVNNGGVERNTYPYKFADDGRSNKRYFYAGSPNLGAKPVKYNTNGSGRDTYIGYNHGGLAGTNSKQTFYNSLRTPSPNQMTMYRTLNNWQHAEKIQKSRMQRDASMRLSAPKFYPNRNKSQHAKL